MGPFALLGFGVAIVPLALLLLILVLVLGGRREPDPEHQRPAAIYYALVQFVTVFAVLFALSAMASSLLNLTTSDGDRGIQGFRSGPNLFGSESRSVTVGPGGRIDRSVLHAYDGGSENDQDWANAGRALIVVVVAGAVFAFHERRRPRFASGTPGHRVWKTYLYAVSFVAVITAVGAMSGALFKLWDGIAPGITGDGPRSHAFRDAGSIAFLGVTAGLVFWRHLSWAEPRRARPAAPPPAWSPPAAPAAAAPVAPAPPPRPPAPRPRPPVAKRAPAKRTPPPRKRSTG